MTVRDVYEATLAEANKVNAPTFTIEEFNYYLEKALLAFSNERYNFYNTNQQLSDDLRVLLKTAKFSFVEDTWNPSTAKVVTTDSDNDGVADGVYVSSLADVKDGISVAATSTGLYAFVASVDYDTVTYPYQIYTTNANYSAGSKIYIKSDQLTSDSFTEDSTTDRILSLTLPASDYFHVLSVRTYWKGTKLSGKSARLTFPAKRLTYDMLNVIENNVFMRPRYSRPYFMVWDNDKNSGVQGYTVESYTAEQNRPRIDVHVGIEATGIELERVEIDYLKMPEKVILDEIDVWSTGDDGSQVLEFPDYLKNQFVRRITDYILEVNRDPRIQTHTQFNQEIPAVPLEYQARQQQQQQPRTNETQ